jgi:long-chain acyl-CoA synthetase
MARCANVADFLLEGKAPDAIALRMLYGDHTYGELVRAVTTTAASLTGAEPRGSLVLLIGENSLFWVAAYLGTMKAGLVCVPLPSNISSPDLDYVLRLTGARLAFVQSKVLTSHARELAGVHVITDRNGFVVPGVASCRSLAEVESASDDVAKFPAVDGNELAAVMFTSGSTGRPRGVMVSHRNIVANTDSIIQYLGLTADDRIMTVLPFHYCFGTSLLHTHLRVGASLVIDPRFLYPETILQRIAETECTGFAGVPSHYQILLRRSTLKKRKFPHLRYVQQAGGHMAPVFVRELRDALPQAQVFVMYGQTEGTARLSYLPPEFLGDKTGSIGRGIPGVTLRVLSGAAEPVTTGEVGEIVAEGENVTLGYWRDPEESAKYFRDGRLYTGDLATVDEDGFIYVVDRGKDFLKCGGVRVSSRQVEEQLLECKGLIEAAVVGAPDDVLGEVVRAFVVPREPTCNGPCRWPTCRSAIDGVLRFSKEHLPAELVPREIVVMPVLPKNSAGKVIKGSLKTL